MILSPTLYGKEKNMMIPEVILLKIDQMANKPIPMTAKIEENIKPRSLRFAPKINALITRAIRKRVTVTYLQIK